MKAAIEYIQFLRDGWGQELHVRVNEAKLQDDLTRFARYGIIRLTTWSNRLYREIAYEEWQCTEFFSNADDCNHVRVRLA